MISPRFILTAFALAFASVVSATERWWLDEASVRDDAADRGRNAAYPYASADRNVQGDSWTQKDMQLWNVSMAGLDPHSSEASFYFELMLDRVIVSRVQAAFQMERENDQQQEPRGLAADRASPYAVSQPVTSRVVPEPACGLLALVGLAGLALRRRRA